jgi:phosphatidate cytidylyltransferase
MALSFKNIIIRVFMGILLTALMFATIEAPPYIYYMLISLIIFIAVMEFFLMFPKKTKSGFFFLALFFSLFFPAYFYFDALWSNIPFEALILGVIIIIAHRTIINRDSPEIKLSRFMNTSAVVLFIGLLFSYQLNIRLYGGGGRLGKDLLIFFYVVSIISDTSAYFFGSRFGRKKIAPVISPSKTVEGSIAAVIGTLVAAVGFYLFFDIVLGRDVFSLFGSIVAAIVIGIPGQVGDLLESLFKRSAGVKDASNLLAGHGGVLDRIDSFLLSSPVFYLLIDYLRRI